MAAIHLTGHITDEGKLEVDLPEGLPAGEVQIVIELAQDESLEEPLEWDEDELRELLRVEPKSGAEIIKRLQERGGWEDQGITSGLEWVQAQRKKHERKFPEW